MYHPAAFENSRCWVQSVGFHLVCASTPIAVIVILEIARDFVKAVVVQNIVYDVVPVEQIHNRRTLVRLSALPRVKREVKQQACTAVWSRTTCIVRIFIFLSVDVVASSVCELRTRRAVCIVPPKR